MISYSRADARDWVRHEMTGVVNVIIASYTHDLRGLNEAAIRHDVRRDIELGFRGALLVCETAMSADEYIRFVEWAADEAKGRLVLFFHASFNTLEENIEVAKRARDAGAQAVLLAYPPSFYPSSLRDVYDYTAGFCDAVDLAVMLFPVPLWGFERFHAASIPIDMLVEMVDDLPTVTMIKAEGGMPSIGGFVEVWNRLHERVVVTMPLEAQAIPLAGLVPLQLIGTSNTECLGDGVPRMLRLAQQGRHDEAMSLFWALDPARRANERVGVAGSNAVNRAVWKYQAWLTGFNGGPLRQPTPRILAPQMAGYRAGAVKSGVLAPGTERDEDFFVGRNPA